MSWGANVMNTPALAGTVIGSTVLGTLAAGWLVTLTPLPAYVARPARAAISMDRAISSVAPILSPTVEALPPAAEAATVKATSSLISAPPPPAHPARIAALPRAARAGPSEIPLKRRHLTRVTSLHLSPPLPQMHPASRPHLAGALTPSEINRLRMSLHLSPDQEAQWSPVADILRQLARRQIAALKNGEEPSLGSTTELMHFYATAQPLLRNLREDQKVEVRALARRMGFGSFASYI